MPQPFPLRRPSRSLALVALVVWCMMRFAGDRSPVEQTLAQDRGQTLAQKPTATESVAAPEKADAKERPHSETPIPRKTKKRERTAKPIVQSRPYPVFGIDEVLDHLATTGAKLHKAGQAKGDVELRKNLDRKTCSLTLAAPGEETISDRDLYKRACESVFIVCSLYKGSDNENWQTSLATAFVVAEDGVLSSSCHVFDNEDTADAVIVMDVKKNVYPVTELLASNKLADTCLFRIDAKNLKPLPFAQEALPGTVARIVAHPGDSFFFFSSGHVSNYERDQDAVLWMNVTADFGQGSSGGPVFNELGHVIGQVSRTYTLYSGGSATRSRPRRIAGVAQPRQRSALAQLDANSPKVAPKKPAVAGEAAAEADADADEIMDPQMVFKSCVPVQSLRGLITAKPAP